jgi:Na+-transporting methylmalonyl-CoA/oxaloacetate decarboxylase beta subunit
MKKKIILFLFLTNSIILLIFFIPVLQEIFHIFVSTNANTIGIIGGTDGPTAIFISSRFVWFPIVLILLEILLGIVLILSHYDK